MQKISESPLKKCPKCGGKIEKMVSATSFQLKGTGWYKTDYAASAVKKDAAEPKKEKSEIKSVETQPKSDK